MNGKEEVVCESSIDDRSGGATRWARGGELFRREFRYPVLLKAALWLSLLVCCAGAPLVGILARFGPREERSAALSGFAAVFLVVVGLCVIALRRLRETISIDRRRITRLAPGARPKSLNWEDVTGLRETARGFEVQSGDPPEVIHVSRHLYPLSELMELLFLHTPPRAVLPRPTQFTLRALFLLILLASVCLGTGRMMIESYEGAVVAQAVLVVVWGAIYLSYHLLGPLVVLCAGGAVGLLVGCLPAVAALILDNPPGFTNVLLGALLASCMWGIVTSVVYAFVSTAAFLVPQEW